MITRRLLGPGFTSLNLTTACVLAAIAAMHPPVLAQDAAKAASPTFARDVAPILQRSCQHCHPPGAIAPISLPP